VPYELPGCRLPAECRHRETLALAEPDRLLDADDLAARWKVPRSHVYRLTRTGAIKSVKLGRYYRYRLHAVLQFEENGGTA
jgi:excisionase family DNA binding protein